MILLDTHTLIWLKAEPVKLSARASEAIRAARLGEGLAISAISLWELAWIATHGRLSFTGTVDSFVERITADIAIRPITAKIAVLASQLPSTFPGDPSDCLIAATALDEGCALVTKDRSIRSCRQIKTIW
jgi:PIN domain nuclease of toxin-antitoxin system